MIRVRRETQKLYHPKTGATITVFKVAVPTHMTSGWQPVEEPPAPPPAAPEPPAEVKAEPSADDPAPRKRRPFTTSEEPTDGDV